MGVIPRSGSLIVLALFTATIAAAQPRDARHDACADTTAILAHQKCPLVLEFNGVRGTRDWRLIAVASRFHAMKLDRLVQGDSAHKYALEYEHAARVGTRMNRVGSGLLMGSVVALFTIRCGHGEVPGTCSSSAQWQAASGSLMALSAVGIELVQLAFKHEAWVAADKAIWWHNATVGDRQ